MPTKEPTELALAPESESQLVALHSEPSVPEMMQSLIKQGVTADNVTAFERLVALKERMDDKKAEREFAAAFVKLQTDIPVIVARAGVPDKHGNLKYVFAPYESIMEEVRPLLQRHGFTVTFSMTFAEVRVTQHCTLMHVGGHSRTNKFAVRIGSGPPGSSEAQGDGAAATYAKRFALCSALNITIEKDYDGRDDASVEGAPISHDKAQYLREQVKETNSNEAAFLQFAGVKTYEEITENSYDRCVRALAAKARRI